MTDFTSQNQALLLRAALFQMMGRFQWYTMTDMANFLNNREKTTWSAFTQPDGTKLFVINHPNDLKDCTWLVPRSYYAKPIIIKGSATVTQDFGHATPNLNAKLHHSLDFADTVQMLRTAGQFVLLPFLPHAAPG